jgi:hypothetical protein
MSDIKSGELQPMSEGKKLQGKVTVITGGIRG